MVQRRRRRRRRRGWEAWAAVLCTRRRVLWKFKSICLSCAPR
jgi:hypothetical protein